MIQASKLIRQGQGLAPALIKRAASLVLDWDTRQKSRFEGTDSHGRQLGVFLPRGTLVRGGDVLIAEDGSIVKVIAALQSVLKITPCAAHGTPFDLTRAAYHLGNRHVPIELTPNHLKIEPDHVLAEMLSAMHLSVTSVSEAFEPEGGAYSAGEHSHASNSTVSPAPAAPTSLAKPHVHGPDCNHSQAPVHAHTPFAEAIKPQVIQIHPHKPHSH